jgi:hypothetical protein
MGAGVTANGSPGLAQVLAELVDSNRTGRWLDLMRAGAGEFLAADDSSDWYIVGFESSAYRDLVDAVAAYVGASYAVVKRQQGLATSHPFASAIEEADALALRVDVSAENRQVVDQRLQLLADVWARRPHRAHPAPRTTGRILRELDDAIARGELAEAESLIDELQVSGRLTSSNLEFLRIRLSAAAERWAEILTRADIDDLVRMRLPRAIATLLVEAVFHLHVEPHVADEPAALVERFRQRVEPTLGPAFRDPTQAHTSGQRKAWIVYAAAIEPPSPTIRDVVLELTPSDAPERTFIENVGALCDTIPEPVAVSDEAQIEELVRTGDLAGAWRTTRDASLEPVTRVRALLHIAYEANNPVWAEHAVRDAQSLSEEHPTLLLGRTTRLHLAELSALLAADGTVISDWLSWLRALSTHENPNQLVEVARDQGSSWRVEAMLSDASTPALLLDIATADPGRAEVLRQIRPLFTPAVLDEFDSNAERQTGRTPVLATLAEVIASEERIGHYELAALLDLAECVLAVSATEDEYEAVVERGLREAWLRAGSARELGWLADAVLLVARAGDRFLRQRDAFLDVAAASVASYPVLYDEDREALLEAFAFAGYELAIVPSASAESQVSDDREAWARLSSMKTVIYTLSEAAGARARTFLLERAPGADVVVLSQHDADRRLIEHARRADLIAIATKAAKHAATIEIEKQRRPESTVVYPTGKGWSSLVGALREGCRALG